MNDQELRAFVRDAVARRLGGRPAAATPVPGQSERSGPEPATSDHASHAVYVTLVNVGDACLIEPSVACSHCEYCKSHGH
jgi:hypothetical protein